jgi:hypothetical protein
MEIIKFNQFKTNESENDIENYMVFSNLQTIKRLVDKMLEIDPKKLDELLKEHSWAVDHICTSKDDIEEVFNFLESNQDLK